MQWTSPLTLQHHSLSVQPHGAEAQQTKHERFDPKHNRCTSRLIAIVYDDPDTHPKQFPMDIPSHISPCKINLSPRKFPKCQHGLLVMQYVTPIYRISYCPQLPMLSRGKHWGQGKKLTTFFSRRPSKHRPNLPNQPLQPSKNVPFTGFTTAYCCCNQRFGGARLRFGGGQLPPCPNVKPRLDVIIR